jgi:DNA-binding protein Fis
LEEASKILGINKAVLVKKIEKYEIRIEK